MCRLLQINKTRTTPYHPRSDGMIERLNKTIKQILSRYISISQTDWDRYIDGIAMAYNSTPHETTGITPYRMVFGTEISIPLDLVSDRIQEGEEEEVPVSESEYVRNLENELDLTHQVARETIGKSTERQKIQYDRKVHERTYDIGDLVRRHQKNVRVGIKEKLSRNWTGPWVVVQRLSDILYVIRIAKTLKTHCNSCG